MKKFGYPRLSVRPGKDVEDAINAEAELNGCTTSEALRRLINKATDRNRSVSIYAQLFDFMFHESSEEVQVRILVKLFEEGGAYAATLADHNRLVALVRLLGHPDPGRIWKLICLTRKVLSN